MGLAERRIARDFQNDDLPNLQSQIDEAAGFSLPVEVRWDTIMPNGESHLFRDGWTGVFFEPLIAALRSITRDDMGRDALKQGLERVVIQNSAGNHNFETWAVLEGKVLTLDHDPIANISETGPRTGSLIQILESGL